MVLSLDQLKNCIYSYITRESCGLYDNPLADVNKIQNVEREECDPFHEAEDASASYVATEIPNNNLHAVGESPVKKRWLQERKYPKKEIKKVTSAVKEKNITCVSR
jgi:hypothetical protein